MTLSKNHKPFPSLDIDTPLAGLIIAPPLLRPLGSGGVERGKEKGRSSAFFFFIFKLWTSVTTWIDLLP